MGETKIEQLSITYKLSMGNCYITAIINKDGRISLSHATNQYRNEKEFIFENSKPDVTYIIGTLIRDAADLVSSIPSNHSD